MPPDTFRDEVSLAQLISDVAYPAQAKLRALRDFAGSEFVTALENDELSEALKVVNDLRARLQSKIAQKNATPPLEMTLRLWKEKTGVDVIKFYALTVIFAAGLPGKRPPIAHARDHALLILRPDLFYSRNGELFQPDSIPAKYRWSAISPLAVKMRKERQSLHKKLKDLMTNPPSVLAPIFDQIWEDWYAATKANGVRLVPRSGNPSTSDA